MKVLVTGGAGFIGSHVAEALLGRGDAVTILDDFNDYYPPRLKRQNVEEVRAAGPIEVVEGDICDAGAVERAFLAASPDAVIHLAARAGVRPSLEAPLLYERVNVHGTMLLLEACRRHGVRKFVFASSSSVYGAEKRVPFREEAGELRPLSPYAATKIAGEKICYTYAHLWGLGVTCLRLFTVYGPRQRPDLAIRKFIERILRGEPIPVYGDGTSGRDYTFVADTVAGILGALDYDGGWDVFNLGNSHPVKLKDLIAAIEECTGKKARIERLPEQPGDVPLTWADISRAQEALGYRPDTRLEEGLRIMVEWCAARLEGGPSG